MSKQSKTPELRARALAKRLLTSGGATPTPNREQFTSSRDVTVTLQGIPLLMLDKVRLQLRKDWERDERALPSKPTYTAELAGGGNQTFEHDEKSLSTPEDKIAWADYLLAQERWDREINERILRIVLSKGVVPSQDLTDEAEWVQDQIFLGFTMPPPGIARRLHFIETEVIGTPADIMAIMSKVMELSGVPSEDVDAAEESFRDAMEAVPAESESTADQDGAVEP